MLNLKLVFGLALALLLSACLSAPQSAALRQNHDASLSAPVLLSQVPFFAQELYQCGPAALATILTASHVNVTPDQLVPLVYVPEREGSFQVEMMAATRSLGRLAYRITPTLEALFTEVAAGHPALVLQNLGLAWYPRWHFAVVKGFDLQRGKIILNSGVDENYELAITTFERTWARSQHWAILALAPGTMPAMGEPGTYFSTLAAFEQTNPSAPVASAYISGLGQWPGDINLRMGYGNLLYAQNNPELAASQFTALLEEHPDYAPAHNNLAQILLEQGQVQRAAQHAQRAVELGGDYLENYQSTLRTIELSLQ